MGANPRRPIAPSAPMTRATTAQPAGAKRNVQWFGRANRRLGSNRLAFPDRPHRLGDNWTAAACRALVTDASVPFI
jgi:hypothetical protein